MAAPVHQQQPFQPPAAALQAPVQGPAPLGIGGAPSNIQAQQPQAQPPGYVEKAVFFIRDLLLWLFETIFSCCRSAPPAPPAPIQAQPAAPVQQPPAGEVPAPVLPAPAVPIQQIGPPAPVEPPAPLAPMQQAQVPAPIQPQAQPLVPVQAPLPLAPADLRAEDRALLGRLQNALPPEQVIRHFKVYFPTENERNEIYFRLGQSAGLSYGQSLAHNLFYTNNYSRNQRIQIGKQMAARDPVLHLGPHLVQKVAAAANRIIQ